MVWMTDDKKEFILYFSYAVETGWCISPTLGETDGDEGEAAV